MLYYVPKSSILLAGTGVWKICSVACGLSSIKIDYSDYPKSLTSRINEVKQKLHLSRLFCCNHTFYCVHMVSVTSASRKKRQHHVITRVIKVDSDSTEFRRIGRGSLGSDWSESSMVAYAINNKMSCISPYVRCDTVETG